MRAFYSSVLAPNLGCCWYSAYWLLSFSSSRSLLLHPRRLVVARICSTAPYLLPRVHRSELLVNYFRDVGVAVKICFFAQALSIKPIGGPTSPAFVCRACR